MKDKVLIFQKRLQNLPQHLSKIEKIILLVLFLAVIISSFLSFNKRLNRSLVPNFNKTFTEAVSGDIRCLIPILKQNEVEKDISRLLFSSLIKFNEKREVVPDLAEKWEVSPDGKNYTFYLRQARWQDGEKITSDDVVFTFLTIKNEQIQSPYFDCFSKIDIQKKDERTVSFVLQKPFAPFLSSLTIPILPEHALKTSGRIVDSPFAKKPIASGPFILDKIEQNRNIITVTLKPNSDYFGGKSKLDKFIFNVYASEAEAITAYTKKEIDGLFLDKQIDGKSVQITLPNIKAIYFNLEKPYLTKDLRKALALATNRDEIIASGISGEKIYFPILPGFLGYKEGEKYDFNLEQAKKYFASARNKPAKLILQTQSDENSQKVSEILKKQWEALGIKIEIANEGNDSFDIMLLGVNQKADPDPYPFWHSSQTQNDGLNFASYGNKQVDKLLEESRQTLDQNIRQQNYKKFIDLLMADIPAIFLYQSINKYYASDNVKGVSDILGVTRADRFNNIVGWDIR